MTALFRFCDHTLSDGDRMEVLSTADVTHLGILALHPGRVVQGQSMETNRWPAGTKKPKHPHTQIAVEIHNLQAKLRPFGLCAVNVRDVGYYLQGDMEVDWGAV